MFMNLSNHTLNEITYDSFCKHTTQTYTHALLLVSLAYLVKM